MNTKMYNAVAALLAETRDHETIHGLLTVMFELSPREAKAIIDRMEDEHAHPWLRKMNERFAVVGKHVIEYSSDTITGQMRFMPPQRFGDFRRRFMHILVDAGWNAKGEHIQRGLGDWWLKQPSRRTYASMREFQKAVEGS